jgi:site-specific recombinase XerD
MTRLRQRMLEDMQIRNFSHNTQESYLLQVSLYARHFRRSPEGLGPRDIRDYQVYLTNDKKLAPGSISIATAALRFLYTVTLKRPWDAEAVLPLPKAQQTLPVILSPGEVRQFLSCVPRRKARTVLTVCYAAGLRIWEAVALRPADIPRIASAKVLPAGVVASAEMLPAIVPATMVSPLPRRGYGHQDDIFGAGRTHQCSPSTLQCRSER